MFTTAFDLVMCHIVILNFLNDLWKLLEINLILLSCYRYLVASRDLKAGSVIIEEDALVVGPIQNSEPICLGCYISIENLDTCTRY